MYYLLYVGEFFGDACWVVRVGIFWHFRGRLYINILNCFLANALLCCKKHWPVFTYGGVTRRGCRKTWGTRKSNANERNTSNANEIRDTNANVRNTLIFFSAAHGRGGDGPIKLPDSMCIFSAVDVYFHSI